MSKHCVHMSIEGLLSWTDSELQQMFGGFGPDIRKELEERSLNGEKLIGSQGCEGFDPVSGCPGHNVEVKIEKVVVNAELILTLDSKQDWVNKVPNRLPEKRYHKEDFLWLDQNNNQLVIGEDFMAAETMDSYPVKVYRMKRVIDALKEVQNA